MKQDITVLSLDLDDTLWPIAPVIAGAEKKVMAWFGENSPRVNERFDIAALRGLRDEVAASNPHLAHDLGAMRRLCIEHALTTCGYNAELAEGAWEAFYSARHDVQLFDDAYELLNNLKHSISLAAVTNGNADLERLGLAHHFKTIIRAGDVAARKPEPAIWQALVRQLGCPPEQILHVGDHPLEDVDGARMAGMQAIWLNRNQQVWPLASPLPPIIGDLSQLAPYLARQPDEQHK